MKTLQQPSYDVAVIGAGVFGAWTAYTLCQRGLRVALIDAYGAGNSRSSSGDESRIIRMSYGADDIYTAWSWRALTLWKEFCAATGNALFHETGVLLLARGQNAHALASATAMQRHGIPFERLERAELEHRFPQIAFGEIEWALYEPLSGALLARRAVQAVAQAAMAQGVAFHQVAVAAPLLLPSSLSPQSFIALPLTNGQTIRAGQFVFACGPWLPKLFPDLLAQRIYPTRQEVFYFGLPAGETRFAPPQFPVWLDYEAEFYGLPDLEARGFKIALDRHGTAFDPDHDERLVTAETLREVRDFLARRFPALASAPVAETRVCQYENTANGDFLIDRHPQAENVWLVGGGSGHGFKHGPALGEFVADCLLARHTPEARFLLANKATSKARAVY